MKKSCDKKETETKKVKSENKILNEAIRDNIINVREYEDANVIAQCNNKFDIIEKIIESKRLVKELITYVERLCLEHDTLRNKCS